ncbi:MULTISPECIES: flagellin [Cryobacterium]|uniref:Flagellin n=1 Tax=Cryobacterium levicorallinum TaxID=995038 RepID=A0A1I3BS59_9MICO|nr:MULTISPECIES: flagellin [Cryobacterium]TFB81327.1 hypothetical protein E3O11_16870 [Cryobacterium levicorallinum]TFD61169.1 hypothetical protein E3T41_08280 [Cryobacterium sp. Hh38]GEP28337.1 hypothetical protein CLE01_29350 [Cryobacterium levicorallinum]SFH65125.1 flagellin [Cryobacterium levicorallinum]
MSIQVNTSSSASTALRNLAASQSSLAQPTVALSSGIRDRVVTDTVEFDGKVSQVATENKIAASTPLRDGEMAAQMSKHTQENILAQPGVAMSAQANQSNSDVLQLLQPARK